MRTPSSPRQTLVALGVTVGSFATLQSLLVPVLPIMQTDLHTDTAGITWALTAWLITAAVATPLFGRVGDIVGKRRTFLASIAAALHRGLAPGTRQRRARHRAPAPPAHLAPPGG